MLSKHTSAYSFNLASKANHFTIIRVAIVQVFWHWLLLLLISWTYFLPTWPKAFYSCEAPLNKFLFSIRYFASLWWPKPLFRTLEKLHVSIVFSVIPRTFSPQHTSICLIASIVNSQKYPGVPLLRCHVGLRHYSIRQEKATAIKYYKSVCLMSSYLLWFPFRYSATIHC